jgi:hypothetical protein
MDRARQVFVEFVSDYPWRGMIRPKGSIHVMTEGDAELLIKRGYGKITTKRPPKGTARKDVSSQVEKEPSSKPKK